MSRGKKTVLQPWLSANGDNREGRFIQAGNSLLLSRQFQGLSNPARWTYFCMALESGGNRKFRFPLASAKKYGIGSSTLRRAIDELENKGFIRRESGKNVRAPNSYTFSYGWKETRPP